MIRLFIFITVIAFFQTGISDESDGTIWFGNPDGSPLVFKINSKESVPVWVKTNSDVHAAAIHIPLSTRDYFIVERLGGELFKPFVNDNPPEGNDKGWDVAEITRPVPHKNMDGYTSQGILGFSDLVRKRNLPLHCEKPCLVAEYFMQTADNDSLKGKTYDVFIEGYAEPSKGINLSDTLGERSFILNTYLSQVHFLFPGDINAYFKIDSSDIEKLEDFLENNENIPWPEMRADCNSDGKIDKQDLSFLKQYLNGDDQSSK